ncbi:hypothetical protein NK908_23775, partial [Salmonella enterica subsp. enterica serovar Typhimurium]|nr:hypothetical protein [Salmonella enterica subsp. enterica serovar Typhimurium]
PHSYAGPWRWDPGKARRARRCREGSRWRCSATAKALVTGWRPTADALAFLGVWNTQALSAPDLVVNALIYIPLGIGLRWLTRSWPALLSIALATAFAAALSFGVEAAQAH